MIILYISRIVFLYNWFSSLCLQYSGENASGAYIMNIEIDKIPICT